MEQVTLNVAQQLFDEARNFYSGQVPFLPPDSEIRVIAKQIFDKDQVIYLNQVCN